MEIYQRGIETLIQTLETTNKPTLGIYNLGGLHWVSLAVYKRDLLTVVLYKDSYGIKNQALQQYCSEKGYRFLSNDTCEQTSGVDCGIFALKNMEIFAQNLKNNEYDFYTRFKQYRGFCDLLLAQPLRLEGYSKLYVAGVSRNMLEEPQKRAILSWVRDSKKEDLEMIESKVSKVIAIPSINIRRLGANEILEGGENTITLEIATDDKSFNISSKSCKYGYKISWTQDLEAAQGNAIKEKIRSMQGYIFDSERDRTIICYSLDEDSNVVNFETPPFPPLKLQELLDNLNISNSIHAEQIKEIRGVLEEFQIRVY